MEQMRIIHTGSAHEVGQSADVVKPAGAGGRVMAETAEARVRSAALASQPSTCAYHRWGHIVYNPLSYSLRLEASARNKRSWSWRI